MKAEAKKYMTRKEIEQHLHSAVAGLTPDVLDNIDLSVRQESGTEQVPVFLWRGAWKKAAAAAACVCLVSVTGGIYAYGETRVVSVVGIDVNPGIELSLNRRMRILKAEAVNTDADPILSTADLKGKALEQAMETLVDSMLEHGYLQEERNAVLVTVSDVKRGKKERAGNLAAQDVEKVLKEKDVKAVVYNQQIERTPELEQMAQEYGISCGKAYFVQNLASEDESLDMEELSSLNIAQLSEELERQDVLLADGGETSGNSETDAVNGTDDGEPDEDVRIEEIGGDEEEDESEASDENEGSDEGGASGENGDSDKAEDENEVRVASNDLTDRPGREDGILSDEEDQKAETKTDEEDVRREEQREVEPERVIAATAAEDEEPDIATPANAIPAATPSNAEKVGTPSNAEKVATPSDAEIGPGIEETEDETEEEIEEDDEDETEPQSEELENDLV